MSFARAIALAFVFAGLLLAPQVAAQQPAATPAVGPVVVREVLSQGEPASAPGAILQLVRYTIPPHTRLAVHTHPGMQTAWLESGDLQYTIVAGGPITITRASKSAGTKGSQETLAAGQTITFHPGDSWSEPQGMVHFGENVTDEPVVILVASLLTEGVPPATIVNAGTPTS